jgi:hypothetical protein
MIDESLTKFHAEKPHAHLTYVAVEMHVVSNLWSQILSGMSQKLSTMDGKMPSPIIDSVKKEREPFEMPYEITDEMQDTLNKSQTTATIKSHLEKYGIKVRAIEIADPLEFKDSLAGQKWSVIAKLPGVGVSVPGVGSVSVSILISLPAGFMAIIRHGQKDQKEASQAQSEAGCKPERAPGCRTGNRRKTGD